MRTPNDTTDRSYQLILSLVKYKFVLPLIWSAFAEIPSCLVIYYVLSTAHRRVILMPRAAANASATVGFAGPVNNGSSGTLGSELHRTSEGQLSLSAGMGHRLSTVTAAVSKRLIGTHENLKKMGLTQVLYLTGLIIFTCLGGVMFMYLDTDAGDAAISAYQHRCLRTIADLQTDLDRTCANQSFNACADHIIAALEQVDRCHKECSQNCSKLPSLPMSHFSNAVIFASTTYTTIGYGTIYPTTTICKVVTMIYTFIGIPYFLALLQAIGRWLRMLFTKLWNWSRNKLGRRLRCKKSGRKSTEHQDISGAKGQHSRWFPFLLGVFVSMSYLCLVSVIFQFSLSQEELNYLDSFYFVVQSVTLVGFGEIFPSNSKVVLYHSFSILFGICLMSMCFFILQESLMEEATMATERVSAGVQVLGRKVSRDIVGPFNQRLSSFSQRRRNLSLYSRSDGHVGRRVATADRFGQRGRFRRRTGSIDVDVNLHTGSSFILHDINEDDSFVEGEVKTPTRMGSFRDRWRSLANKSSQSRVRKTMMDKDESTTNCMDDTGLPTNEEDAEDAVTEEQQTYVNGFIVLDNEETFL